MTAYRYPNLSSSEQTGITPVWPCTLMISADPGGFNAETQGNGLYGKVAIEVKSSNGRYQRFKELEFNDDKVCALDLPGATVRVVAVNLTNVTVEIIDSEPEADE